MHIYDISLTISPKLPVWPDDPPIAIERVSDIAAGDDANVSRVNMGVHSGTHVDAPLHFLAEGDPVDQLDLKTLTGRAYVLDLTDIDLIDAQALKEAEIPARTRRILFKTRNSELWSQGETRFQENFVAISADGAQFLVDRGVRLIGVDYLSVAPYDDGITTHKILLSAGVAIIEGLNLSHVDQGRYTLYCLPIKISESDGSPARAILIGV
jgi:arylformamidase